MNLIHNILCSIKARIQSNQDIRKYKALLLEIKQFLKERGVHLLYVEPPVYKKIKGLTAFERERHLNWTFDINKCKKDIDILRMVLGNNVTPEYIMSIFDGGIVVQGQKRKVLLDFNIDHQHIINGRRITTGQPSNYQNTIYTHGACTWRGTGVEDHQTIASFLQENINKFTPPHTRFRVVNSAIGRGSSVYDDYQFIREQVYTKGDIVILGSFGTVGNIRRSFFIKNDIQFIDTSCYFNRPHNYGEWFYDHVLHTNFRGNKVIADVIFNKISLDLKWLQIESKGENFNGEYANIKNIKTLTTGEKIFGDNPELQKYMEGLKAYKRGDEKCINGSIVMNCNPFTLGHRYLIEYASSKVSTLYIFVVEEDRSYFSFEERINLVRKGTADLKNVVVLPSGSFIISATTFPGYFYKNDLRETKIDCTNDLIVFSQYIAPALSIKKRFAGEEPLDPITNQYNEGMKEILPQYGIEFCSIPRKIDDDGIGVISASRVRKNYESGNFGEIEKLVPKTTFEYLQERFKRELDKCDNN